MSLENRAVCLALVVTLTLLTSLANIPSCAATAPSDIQLVYDFGSQTLTMNVSHSTASTKNHFIETIEIRKNGISLLNRSYENQSFGWGMNDTFSVSTVVGDNLTATAVCNKGYSLTTWLIVTSTTATNTVPTDTTSTTDSPGTLLDAGPAIAMGVAVLIFFVLFFMWLKPEYVPDALKQLGSLIWTGVTWFGDKLRGMLSWLRVGLGSLLQQIKTISSSK